MTDDDLLSVLHSAADAVRAALDELGDWGLAGTRPGQYRSDLAADTPAVRVLEAAGIGVLSEESGRSAVAAPGSGSGSGLLAVLDPVDGSTNASRGLPWFATSICVLDDEGARAALVVNQAIGTRFEAVRGGGARRDGVSISPSSCTAAGSGVVGLSGYPPRPLGWRQFRALGAAALDLCSVASGALDAYVDCSRNAHGPWDYLGGMLVCLEAGAAITDAFGRDLVCREHGDRRTPVAAATKELLDELVEARRTF